MSKETENIFSWRRVLRRKNPQERVDFYYEKLKAGYQQSVLEAELVRQQARKPNDSYDQHIQETFEVWASEKTQKRLNTALERRRGKGLNVDKGQETVDLGLAGYFRIKEIHETTMAGKTWRRQTEEYRRRLEKTRQVFDRWPTVERTTSHIPSTIHGGPINWELEVIQDKVKYLQTAKKPKEAARIAEQGISLAFRKIDSWLEENPPDNSEIVASNIGLHLKEIREKVEGGKFKELVGLLSVEAVLAYRKGLATRELNSLIGALGNISAIQEQIPNNHRFATINWKVLYASLFYNGNFSLKERIGYFKKATKNLWETAKRDPRSVARSFLQMFK